MPLPLKLLIALAFWGTTPAVGRLLSDHHAPFVIAFGRFAVASLALLGLCAATGAFKPVPRRHWLRFAMLGATGIALHNGLMFMGLETTQASTASILLGLIAMQVLVLDLLWHRRWPDRLAVVGVLLGFLGSAWVITDGNLSRIGAIGLGSGDGLIFLSGLCWALYSVLGRDLLEEYSPLWVTTVASCSGVMLLLPFLFSSPATTLAVASDPRALLFVGSLGLVGSALGFLWYYEAVQRYGAVQAALFINLVPIFGVVSAALLLEERMRPSILFGGSLVLGGLMLVNRPALLRAAPVED